jgi:hypothetical protein
MFSDNKELTIKYSKAYRRLRNLKKRGRLDVLNAIREHPGFTQTDLRVRVFKDTSLEDQSKMAQCTSDLKRNNLIKEVKNGKFIHYFINKEKEQKLVKIIRSL